MKLPIKIYLEPEVLAKLKDKAREVGYVGRGHLSDYISFIATNDIAILDGNVKKITAYLFKITTKK